MKAHDSYFQQKKSKQGVALSTAMAICIVLALLVAVLVSMASLNITTTQATIDQREAYVQAKSAISFAESYYARHSDEIPGNSGGATSGEALFVFRTNVIAQGADVYITKTSEDPSLMSSAQVQTLKDGAVDTYLEVVNTGAVLDITAYCKYGENNAYKLSKEFDFRNSSTVRPNSFTGNVLYDVSSGHYLRIHVRTSEVFGSEPYVYAWGNARKDNDENARGGSAASNKLTADPIYKGQTYTGTWGSEGPEGSCAMTYEGNGWYVTEIPISYGNGTKIDYINAIVTKPNATRSASSDGQSWEFFGIPVPEEEGQDNGADIYITLNQNKLRDARSVWSHGETTHEGKTEVMTDAPGANYTSIGWTSNDGTYLEDERSYLFSLNGNNMDTFAQYASKWYTVFARKNTVTVHYRTAFDYTGTSSAPASEYTYEGYGWYRTTSYNFNNSLTSPDGKEHVYGDGREIYSTGNNNGILKELFICYYDDGTTKDSAHFGTEEEANDWFYGKGDTIAGEYVTVNVKANEQPVNGTVPTTLEYNSTWISSTPSSTDTDSDTDVAYNGDELIFEELAVAPAQTSGAKPDYAIADIANNFGRPQGSDEPTGHVYENLTPMEQAFDQENFLYTYTYKDQEPGEYRFKVIEVLNETGAIDWDGHSWGNNEDDYTYNVVVKSDVTIKFYSNTKMIAEPIITPVEGAGINSGKSYGLIGAMNNWGQVAGSAESDPNYYDLIDKMTNNENGTYSITLPTGHSSVLTGGKSYEFKIVEMPTDEGALQDYNYSNGDGNGWTHSWGQDGSNANYSFTLGGNELSQWAVTITFTESTKHIDISDPVSLGDDSSNTYYLIGDFNGWADHKFENAKDYKMSDPKIDSEGKKYYEYKINAQEPGSSGVKVISSQAECDPDDAGRTINYDYSWGATMGSGSADFVYDLDATYNVTIRFTYDSSNPANSRITYSLEPYTDNPDNPVTSINFRLWNGYLKNLNSTSDEDRDNGLTTPWDKLYITYTTDSVGDVAGTTVTDKEIELPATGNLVKITLPSNVYTFSFSNLPSTESSSPNYQKTGSISRDKLYSNGVAISNATLFLKKYNDSTNTWEVGDNDEYGVWTNAFTNKHDTVDMVWVGSSQTNYYDAPLVNVLKALAGGGGPYAFSPYQYSSYDVLGDASKNVNFTGASYVTYQGEKYYYVSSSAFGSKSFLIVESNPRTTDPTYENKISGGYLLENEFSLTNDGLYNFDNIPNLNKPGERGSIDRGMQNRAGAIFTSDNQYYNGQTIGLDYYHNYTPSWYTYKVPASTMLNIKNVKGVTGSGNSIITNNPQQITPVKVGSHHSYAPIYIYKDVSDMKYYSYDSSIGKVDMNSSGKVAVYLNKPSSWSNNIKVYAYSAEDSTIEDMHTDSTDGDHNYYKFEFNDGEYCFFQFFDADDYSSHSNDLEQVTKKTGVTYLTGVESDRQYQILCDATTATDTTTINTMSFYLHPRTQATNSFQDLRSAKQGSKIVWSYTYDSTTHQYNKGSSKAIEYIETIFNSETFKNYVAKGNGSDVWTSSGSEDYLELAKAGRRLSTAITNTRIYIADDVTVNPSGTGYIFPEFEYRSDVLAYDSGWTTALKGVYNQALERYTKGYSSVSEAVSDLNNIAKILEDLISSPITTTNPNAVQIIVDDQEIRTKKADGTVEKKGKWGQANLHLYKYNETTTPKWQPVSYSLYETTQADFYAYVFKQAADSPSSNNKYMIAKTTPDDSVAPKELASGKRYIFHTASGQFEEDKSIYTVRCVFDNVSQTGTVTSAYGLYKTNVADQPMVVYFLYDTTVEYNNGTSDISYLIPAGAYTISKSSYAHYSDVPGGGINLFTDNAKAFFTEPSRYGMTKGTTSYSALTTNTLSGGTGDCDIMTNSITASGAISAKAGNKKRVNFRYDGTNGSDTLTLHQSIKLEAGVASMAVNHLTLNGNEFTLKAKTIIFYTDTVILNNNGTTSTISHGTYIFNKSDTAEAEDIYLSTTGTDDDWRTNYTLVDELQSELRGGTYVVKD